MREVSHSVPSRILFLFTVIALFSAAPLRAAWQTIGSGVAVDLNAVDFIDISTGFVAGNTGTILKTVNEGASWSAQPSGTVDNLNDIDFVDASTGLAVGGNGTVLKSTDTGATWFPKTSGTGNTLFSTYWVGTSTAWAVGQGGIIRVSTDAGESWQNGDPSGDITGAPNLRSVFFINSSTGWVAGTAGALYRTSDGGANWQFINTGALQNLRGIFFVDFSTGYLVGDSGAIRKSTDSGTAWSSQVSTDTNFTSVHFISTQTGFVAGERGAIFKSTDNGNSFVVDPTTVTITLHDIFIFSPTLGYAVGASGFILKNFAPTPNTTPTQVTFDPPKGSLKAIDNVFDPTLGQSTQIQYFFTNGGRVSVRIYTAKGRMIKTLVDGEIAPGVYTVSWDGRNDEGEFVASGIYLVHMEAPQFSQNQKIAVIK